MLKTHHGRCKVEEKNGLGDRVEVVAVQLELPPRVPKAEAVEEHRLVAGLDLREELSHGTPVVAQAHHRALGARLPLDLQLALQPRHLLVEVRGSEAASVLRQLLVNAALEARLKLHAGIAPPEGRRDHALERPQVELLGTAFSFHAIDDLFIAADTVLETGSAPES